MPIPLISNFSVNVGEPIDSRLISTSSTSMQSMQYKYEGLTTYRTDLNRSFTWDGNFWQNSSNGIYGGDGKLIEEYTTVDFGTLSTSEFSQTNKLLFSTSTEADGRYLLQLNNLFYRHTSDASGFYTTGEYKSQLIFYNTDDDSSRYGPYIIYNPEPQYGNGYGGISFGSYRSDLNESYDRLRIEGSGLIRFKTFKNPTDATKTLNIGDKGSPSGQPIPFLGFNWNGVNPESSPTDLSSFIEFNDSIISINSFNGSSATHSAIFQRGLLSVNGNLLVNNGTITTSRSILFGTDDSGIYFVRTPNNFGIRYDGARRVAELIASSTGTTPTPLLRWGGPQGFAQTITVLSNITFTQSFTTLFASTVRSEFKMQLWDNVFNPDYGFNVNSKVADDYSDLAFKRTSSAADNIKNDTNEDGTAAATGMVWVDQIGFAKGGPADTVRTTGEFIIYIGTSYVASKTDESLVAKNTFEVDARDYDRIYYFYSDGMRRNISHQVRWWLGEPSSTTPGTYRYVQIGNIETGNRDGNGGGTETDSYGNVNYRTRYYSQTVIVPAYMTFRIQFRFHVNLNYTTPSNIGNSPRVFMNVIRSGKFRSLGFVTPTNVTPYTTAAVGQAGLGYPGSVLEGGGGGTPTPSPGPGTP